MDWIAAAINEPAAVKSMDSSSKGDEGVDKPPNFDDFLHRRGQHQQQADQPSRSATGTGLNRSNFNFDNNSRTAGSSFGNVRIHRTEMQHYLQGLMNSQNNNQGRPYSDNPKVKAEMSDHLKSGFSGMMDPRQRFGPNNIMIDKTSFLKGDNGGEGGGGSSSHQASLGIASNNNVNKGGGSGGLPDSPNSLPKTSDTSLPLPSPPDKDKGNTGNSRQKNDKAVEVHREDHVIARFRTQTECARYLRATPEAVSYHCSKGGGICNGLVIKPLAAAEAARLAETSSDNNKNDDDGDGPTGAPPGGPQFGLFEGAVQYRPKERPQLKPETVAILKDWLLSPDHMDNPYPNPRESEMLMMKTGLDKTQLKHWFNNARKRILKPLLKNGGRKFPSPPRAKTAREVKGGGGVGGGVGGGSQAAKKRKSDSSNSSSAGSRKTRKSDGRSGRESPTTSVAAKLEADDIAGGISNSLMGGSMCGPIGSASSHDTHKASNISSSQRQLQRLEQRQFEQRQQQLLLEERQRVRPRQFDNPFMDNYVRSCGNFGRGDSDDGNSGNSNNMMSMNMNQYERLMGFNNSGMNDMISQSTMNGMSREGGMMGYGDSMGGMMKDSMRGIMNDSVSGMMRDSMSGMMRDSMNGRMRDSMNGRMRDSMGGMMRDYMGGMMRDSMGGMMRDSSGGMMRNSMNDMMNGASRNSYNDNYGSSSMGGGGFQGRASNVIGGAGFNGCMEVNDSNNLYDRFNEYPTSRISSDPRQKVAINGNNSHHGPQQDRFNQDSNKDSCNDSSENNPFCQPLQGQGRQGDARQKGNPSDDLPGEGSSSCPDDSARSNAIFKQQVATMAMNEASVAFKEMEDAFAHARGVLVAARTTPRGRGGEERNVEDDPMVVEANERAKKCQNVAMFKLKVSQRASEEAANAYDAYQRMVDRMDNRGIGGVHGGDVGGSGGGTEGGPMMSLQGNESQF